jgi:dihydroorotase-like cyclic amidohydrolase
MTANKQIIRGGRLLDADAHSAAPADILIDGDTIIEIGAPGMAGRTTPPPSTPPTGC